MDRKLVDLADEIEAALALEGDVPERVLAAIAGFSATRLAREDLESTDAVLRLIHGVKPGWSLAIRGKASLPNGHWRCTLRQSSSRDNDEYLGVGQGPTLPHALLACLLKTMAYAPG